MKEKLVGFSWIFVLLGLFIFSFTQVDLGIAFSKSPQLQKILFSFQHIGYFQRPLSTLIYLIILALLFILYSCFLYLTHKDRIKKKFIWSIILLSSVILVLSYNAFSYDLFNYIFDAKIITFYHQNPYLHKALDYPGDPMLGFMHWTHRLYPYGPLWLGLTVPLSLLGSHIFWITFFLFKFLIGGFYLGSVYLLYQINKKILPKYQNFNLVLFSLNPLVLIESLVSSHNDIVMIFFALLGVYLFLQGKRILSLLLIILSALVKIPTSFIAVPVILSFLPIKQKLDDRRFVWGLILFSSAALFYVLTRLEMQPWYILWVFPFVCLLKPNKYLVSGFIGLTLGLLLRYAPFFYFGNWDGIVGNIEFVSTIGMPIIFLLIVFFFDKLNYGKNT